MKDFEKYVDAVFQPLIDADYKNVLINQGYLDTRDNIILMARGEVKQAKEDERKETKQLVRWMLNLNQKIMRFEVFKGLRGYPLTHFQNKYLTKENKNNNTKEQKMNKIEIKESMRQKWTSGNEIPVSSIRITREEYDQLIQQVKDDIIDGLLKKIGIYLYE